MIDEGGFHRNSPLSIFTLAETNLKENRLFSRAFFKITTLEIASGIISEIEADTLAEQDWLVLDNFLREDLRVQLQRFLDQKISENELHKAGIGNLGNFQIDSSVRGDWVYWLDKDRDIGLTAFFDLIETVKNQLNRLCFLGLSEYEFHLAHYPAGTFYERHLDQFNEMSNRQISMVFYLNKNWTPPCGGELRIYSGDTFVDVAPIPGRLVIFKSGVVEHEVLPTTASRYSLTGWLLRKPSGLGFL